MADPAADLVLGQVHRDGEQPGRELSPGAVALPVDVHAEEDFLREILGTMPIPDISINRVQDPLRVSIHQTGESSLGAFHDLPHQIFVTGGDQIGWFRTGGHAGPFWWGRYVTGLHQPGPVGSRLTGQDA